MTSGFHLKLVGFDNNRNKVWEPDASNRVWRPCDGDSLWLKSGQCDVRSEPLSLTTLALEVLLPASLSQAPALSLLDVAEGATTTLISTATRVYPGSPLFQIASYAPAIYPQAAYTLSANTGESSTISRPFPADPADLSETSRFALGAQRLVEDLSHGGANGDARHPAQGFVELRIGRGRCSLSIGNAPPYLTAPAAPSADGWSAQLPVANDTTTSIQLLPMHGSESRPYDWIDTSRYFTPSAAIATYYLTEGVFGVATSGKTVFKEPPDRTALMQSAFGAAIVRSGVFQAREMPHGATIAGDSVFFVVHAPHAVVAALVLVKESAAGAATRRLIPMTLTPDTFYWWCAVSTSEAGAGARYHFLLNDTQEVMDPAAREVQDNGDFDVKLGSDPNDPKTSWSIVLDVNAVRATAWQQALANHGLGATVDLRNARATLHGSAARCSHAAGFIGRRTSARQPT